jgi:medium-chain acyl-[acyl-carrier-protein] hydrolase
MNSMIHLPSKSWIVRLRTVVSPSVRFFCFPHAGGSASAYRSWLEDLPRKVELCGIQFPGRASRISEPLPLSISDIVEALIADGYSYFADTPIAIFGHSFGALVAFEFAQRLHAMRVGPAHLFVSAQIAPQLPDPEPPMRQLCDSAFISEMSRRYDGIPAEILREQEMMQLLLPALRADMTLKETYRFTSRPKLNCPLSAFGGCQDASVTADGLDAWCVQTSGAFKLRMFPGNHFFVHSERKGLLRAITEDLNLALHGLS